MLKQCQWLRTKRCSATTSKQAFETTSQQIANAYDCFEAIKNHFDTDEWRKSHGANAVTALHAIWEPTADIEARRPNTDESFKRIDGILNSYQFLVVGTDEVAFRRHGCWCVGCRAAVRAARGEGLGVEFVTRRARGRKDDGGARVGWGVLARSTDRRQEEQAYLGYKVRRGRGTGGSETSPRSTDAARPT